MKKVNTNRIRFYEFLYGDIESHELESWVYSNKELEKELSQECYIDLISYSFKSRDLKSYITNLVKLFFDWQEYEKWRTIKLLNQIVEDKIEIVLAARKLNQLYIDQEESIKWPLITIKLGVGFNSVLDNCPIETEYHHWNKESLKKQLEPVTWYKEDFKRTASIELLELINTDTKSIDMGQIVSNKDLHDKFAEKLRFPDFYGQNWDAMWESITSLVEMPKNLILYNWMKFEKELPTDANTLSEIIQDYNKDSNSSKIKVKAGNIRYDRISTRTS